MRIYEYCTLLERLRLQKALKAGSRGRLGLSHLAITLLHHANRLRTSMSAIASIGNAYRHCRVSSLKTVDGCASGRIAIVRCNDMSEVVVK
jgi:hypothetical protein